jgi:hypothetical protein
LIKLIGISMARIPCGIEAFVEVQERCGRRHFIGEIKGHVIR